MSHPQQLDLLAVAHPHSRQAGMLVALERIDPAWDLITVRLDGSSLVWCALRHTDGAMVPPNPRSMPLHRIEVERADQRRWFGLFLESMREVAACAAENRKRAAVERCKLYDCRNGFHRCGA